MPAVSSLSQLKCARLHPWGAEGLTQVQGPQGHGHSILQQSARSLQLTIQRNALLWAQGVKEGSAQRTMMTPLPRAQPAPARRAACTAASFSAGARPACTSAMPSRRPILAALAGLSPVSIITRIASASLGAPLRQAPLCSALTLAALLSRTRSANVNTL